MQNLLRSMDDAKECDSQSHLLLRNELLEPRLGKLLSKLRPLQHLQEEQAVRIPATVMEYTHARMIKAYLMKRAYSACFQYCR